MVQEPQVQQAPRQNRRDKNGVMFQFSAPPPRFRQELQNTPEALWEMAQQYVEENRSYIAWVSKRYLPFASAESGDIQHQALVATFEALVKCLKKNDLEKFNGYFFYGFRRACLSMAAGPLQIPYGEDITNMAGSSSSENSPLELLLRHEDERLRVRQTDLLMQAAFSMMSRKQQSAWSVYMASASEGTERTDEAARGLGVSRREAYLLLDRGIGRVRRATEVGLIVLDEDSGLYEVRDAQPVGAPRKRPAQEE